MGPDHEITLKMKELGVTDSSSFFLFFHHPITFRFFMIKLSKEYVKHIRVYMLRVVYLNLKEQGAAIDA